MTVLNHSISVPRHPVSLMRRVYRYILPDVEQELTAWRAVAEQIPDDELRKQALASMNAKRFHCQGGAVYAAAHLAKRHVIIPLIVAFQTISDYLDNLCDRSTSQDGDDFRLLHQSMLDAINPQPSAEAKDYYALHHEKEDGGYLEQLVRRCQSCIVELPSYTDVYPTIREWVSLYCDLQVYKHIQHDQREDALLRWWDEHRADYPDLSWNEFAAATGSTLGVFMLFLSASDDNFNTEAIPAIEQAYFPYISGLHILLDYLIDQEEDRIGGDLNFCHYYESEAQTVTRFSYITEQARKLSKGLAGHRFHHMIIEGLLALYLSDPKVKKQQDVQAVSKQLMRRSPLTRIFFWFNSYWIRKMV